MGDNSPRALADPTWATDSEQTTAVIGGHERDVIDHYGSVTSITFPGVPPQEGARLAALDIDVSRTDVVDQDDPSVLHIGPYLLTVGTNQEYPESRLTSVEDLEAFGHAIIAAAQTVRAFLANEAGSIATNDVADKEDAS